MSFVLRSDGSRASLQSRNIRDVKGCATGDRSRRKKDPTAIRRFSLYYNVLRSRRDSLQKNRNVSRRGGPSGASARPAPAVPSGTVPSVLLLSTDPWAFGDPTALSAPSQDYLRFQVKLPGFTAATEVRMDISQAVMYDTNMAVFMSRTGDKLYMEGTSMLFHGN
eukprot:7850930-Pyramimonas_sp.AAC.1